MDGCRMLRASLLGVVVLLLTVPAPLWGAAASLGSARGVRGVEMSLDGGTTWLSLGTAPLPLMPDARIRARSGAARIDLGDGSRVDVLPFSAMAVRDTGRATEVVLAHGRLGFRLPSVTRVEIRTAAARLVPMREGTMVGQVMVGGDGVMGLRMEAGRLRVHEISGSRRVMLASADPVFLPTRPGTTASLFGEDVPAAPPEGAKGVFTPEGESLGYVGPDGQLVVHPGYTRDLTRPFPKQLVRLAMAQIPEARRVDATPVFDVHGGYVGYLAGPVFYAQPPQTQALEEEGAPESGPSAPQVVAVGEGVAGAMAGGLWLGGVISGGGDDDAGPARVATPFRLRR